MTAANSNSNNLFAHILKNSLFTPRQFDIISQRLHNAGRRENISSGAYYRQLKQCRDKVTAILYSIILLQSTGIVQPDALMSLNRLAEQMSVIFASEDSDISLKEDSINGVMSVMDKLMKRMSKL
jgi:hypothetical protein